MTTGPGDYEAWADLPAEAANRATSAHRLAELAVAHPELWEAIVRNPSCDPGYRDWILTQRPDLACVLAEEDAAWDLTHVATTDEVTAPTPTVPMNAVPAMRLGDVGSRGGGAWDDGRLDSGGQTFGGPAVGGQDVGRRAGLRRGRLVGLIAGAGVAALLLVLTGALVQTIVTGGRLPFLPSVAVDREEVTADDREVPSGASDEDGASEDGAEVSEVAGGATETEPSDSAEPFEGAEPSSAAADEETDVDSAGSGTVADATTPPPASPDEEKADSGDSPGSDSAPDGDSSADDSPDGDVSGPAEGSGTGGARAATAPIDDPTYTFELGDDGSYVLISSPSRNISCELGGSYYGCSIADRPAEAGCVGDRIASYLAYDGMTPIHNCGVAYLGAEGDHLIVLGYGETITNGYTSCRSQETGLTCWNEYDGSGMTLSASSVELF